MKKRAHHSKSRRGCSNCKSKHVKCDEQGPPCANCTARKTEESCAYSLDASAKIPSSRISNSPSTQPTDSDNQATQARHILELELMHRWTATTYKCVLQMDNDAHYHQIEIPRAALSEHYLLNSIYSLTALEVAVRGWDGDKWADIPSLHSSNPPIDRKFYIRAALEYYDKAIGLFRAEIDKLRPKTYHCAYMFACHVFIINMALPQAVPTEDEPALQDMPQGASSSKVFTRLLTTFNLMQGAGRIVQMDPNWWVNTPIQPIMHEGIAAVTAVTQAGLKPESKVVWQRVVAVADAEAPGWLESPVYGGSMDQLATLMLIEDGDVVIHGWTIALPMVMRQDFLDAFLAREKLALFIMMHWAVYLVDDERWFWWLKDVGRETLSEICSILKGMREPLNAVGAWRGGIQWSEDKLARTSTRSDEDEEMG